MPLEYTIGDSVEVELAAGGAKVYCDTAELDLSRDDRLYCATVIGEVGKHDLRVALRGNVHGRRHDGRPLTAVVKASWPRPLPPPPPTGFASTLDEYDLAQLFSHETQAWEVVMVVAKAKSPNGKLYVATAPGGSVLVDQKSHELDSGVSDAVAVPAELLRAHRDCTENIGKEKSPVRWHRYKADNQRKKEARKAFWESPGEDRKVFDIGPRVTPPAAASSADDAGEARTPRATPPAAAAAPAPAAAPAAAPASDEELLASRKRALEAAEATVAGIKSDVKTISTRIVRRRIEDAQAKERAAAAQRAAAEHELAELEKL